MHFYDNARFFFHLLFWKWAEVSGLVFTYIGGPTTAQDANILVSIEPLNLSGSTLGTADSPKPSFDPPSSAVQLDSTKGPFKAFGNLPGNSKY